MIFNKILNYFFYKLKFILIFLFLNIYRKNRNTNINKYHIKYTRN